MGEKKSFILYNDYQDIINDLSDADAAALFRALFAYANGDDIEELSPVAKVSFAFFKKQIDRDEEKYAKRCEKNKANGKKGGRPKKDETEENQEEPKKTERFSEKPKKADNDNDNDNDNDTTYGSNKSNVQKPPTESAVNSLFDSMWAIYPVKKGKGQVKLAARKRLYEIGLEEIRRAIDRYLSELEKDSWRQPQNGSTFFNSGYIDYIDANFEPSEVRQPEIKPKLNNTAAMLEAHYNMVNEWIGDDET